MHGTVRRGSAVPVFGEALGDVFKIAVGLALGADDGGDGFVVCDATRAEGAVGEEGWVEVVGDDGDDGGEGEVVEERVVLAAVFAVGFVLARHDVDGEFFVGVFGGEGDILFEQAGREVVVVAAAEVEVFAVGADVRFDCAVAV